MLKRVSLFTIAFVVIVLASCSSQNATLSLSPKEIAHRVGGNFGDRQAKIIKVKKTKSDSNKEPMYLMVIQGDFTKGHKTAKYLRFSATADKFYYWALEASKDKYFNKIVWSKE